MDHPLFKVSNNFITKTYRIMAVSIGYLSLILTFFLCFSTNSLITVLADTNTTDDLINNVCKNTTIFDFCRAVIYSDPLAANADQYTLAFIVFQQAFTNTSKSTDHMESLLKSNEFGDKDQILGTDKCLLLYRWAVHSFGEALDNINSDTYYELDRYAADAEGYARDCEASFNGRPVPAPISKKNQDLIKYSNVCLAVSQLFPYN